MLLYTLAMPMELLMPPTADDRCYGRIEGRLCLCRTAGGELVIDRLISTDPADYLNPRLAPGTTVFVKREETSPLPGENG